MEGDLSCPLCGCNESKLLHELSQGRLVTCDRCQLVFFSPLPTPSELQDFYENGYHDRLEAGDMGTSAYAVNRYVFLERLLNQYQPALLENTHRTLLDIGCGTGAFLAIAQQAGWQVAGTEITYSAVELASQKIGDSVHHGDVLALDLPPSAYSLITSYHVIEHLLDPVAHLRRCRQLLAADGVLLIETPNLASLGARIRGKHWSHIIPPEHLMYFSPSSLAYALRTAGFDRVVTLTSAPLTVKSVEHWPLPLRKLTEAVYSLAPRLNLGAAVNAIAFKS